MIQTMIDYYYQHQTTEIVMEIKVGTIVRLKEQNILGIVTEMTIYEHIIVDWFEPVWGQKIWNTKADYFREKLEIIC